jgi:hypothetical protein
VCTSIAGSSLDNDISSYRDYSRNDDDDRGGLVLKYENGPTCTYDNTKKTALRLDMYCDSGKSTPVITYVGT